MRSTSASGAEQAVRCPARARRRADRALGVLGADGTPGAARSRRSRCTAFDTARHVQEVPGAGLELKQAQAGRARAARPPRRGPIRRVNRVGAVNAFWFASARRRASSASPRRRSGRRAGGARRASRDGSESARHRSRSGTRQNPREEHQLDMGESSRPSAKARLRLPNAAFAIAPIRPRSACRDAGSISLGEADRTKHHPSVL